MPFGIPPPPDDSFDRLAVGLGDNVTDLGHVSNALLGNISEGYAANQADLSRVQRGVKSKLTAGVRANSKDLAPMAQDVTLRLAAGHTANAADLMNVPIPHTTIVPVSAPSSSGYVSGPQSVPSPTITPSGINPQPIVPPSPNPSQTQYYWQCCTGTVSPYGTIYAATNAIGERMCLVEVPPGIIFAAVSPVFTNRNDAADWINTPDGQNACGSSANNPPSVGPPIGPPSGKGQYVCSICLNDTSKLFPGYTTYWKSPKGNFVGIYAMPMILPPLYEGAGPFNSPADAIAWLSDPKNCSYCDGCQITPGPIPPITPPPISPPPGPIPPITIGGPPPSPPPTPPPPSPPPIIVSPGCVVQSACFRGGIGLPGTQEFCDCLSQFQIDISSVAQLLRNWLDNNITADGIVAAIDGYEPQGSVTNPGGYVQDGIMYAIKLVANYAKPNWDFLIQTIRCVLDIATEIRTAGNPNVYIGLMMLKWLTTLLHDLELGTDALAWVVANIEIVFGPLDSLHDRLINWAMPVEIPSPTEATHAWLMGQIDPSVRDCVWQLHGLNPGMYLNFAMGEAEALTADEIIQIGYRRQLNTDTIADILRDHGWQRDWDRDARLELHWEIPTIGDHLHWLSRNVDDADYVKQYGLLDGFAPDQFINQILPELHGYQTLQQTNRDFWATFGLDLTAQGMLPRNAAYHYAAHWIQPSPEQMREFVFRLRPGKPDVQTPFTIDDYKRILAEQDYAPLAREWFAATANPVPALTYILGMYRQNVIDDVGLQSYHMDLGYTQQDSERFVGVDRIAKAQYRASRFGGWTARAIAKAVALGVMTEQDGQTKFQAIGSTAQEATDAFAAARTALAEQITVRSRSRALTRTMIRVTKALTVGVMSGSDAVSMLMGLGFQEGYANQIVSAEQAAASTAVVVQGTKAIRQQYIDGYIDVTAAQNALASIGLIPDKQRELLSLWNLQNTPRRKHRTAKEIVGDVANGYYDTSTALMRLLNLGYDQADSMLYLADAQGAIAKRFAQAQAAAQRDARTAAKLQQQLANEARKQAKQLAADARREAPRSILVKWLRLGVIGLDEFKTRMTAQNYTATDIDRYALDVIKDVSESILQRWANEGHINDSYFIARLARLGYSAVDIANFTAEVDAKRAKQASKQKAQPPHP